MNRLRLSGGIFSASLLWTLLVSSFPAQQPPAKEPVPPQVFDPGFVPGPPSAFQKLTKQQLEQLKKALQKGAQQPAPNATPGTPPQGPAPPAGVPEPFRSKEGKKGWRVTIPGNRPLATPAVADHQLFVGGGFGSHEFYALDAMTGKQQWVYRTGDDGPTAAVIDGDYIAFNTESCELELITKAGKPLWKHWLGDPLMSMPAIHNGKVYMAYPDSKGGGGHKLACFDVKTGKEQWKQPIAGEIITAPVIDNDCVYLSCLEGTLFCFACPDGQLVFREKKNATSSPAVHNGKLYYSQRDTKVVAGADGKKVHQQEEALALREPAGKPGTPGANPIGASGLGALGGFGGSYKTFGETTRPADYLDAGKRKAVSEQEKKNQNADAGVGFSAAPGAAKLEQASGNLGQSTVAGVWAYQGSRPFIYKDQLFSSMGDAVKCVDPKTEKVVWKHSVRDGKDKRPLVDAALTPPAIVNGKIFVGTTAGQVICLNAADGQELWRATVGDPILFQPAIAYGRVFVATGNGRIYCIETGSERDHGWMMWGANPQHNGQVR